MLLCSMSFVREFLLPDNVLKHNSIALFNFPLVSFMMDISNTCRQSVSTCSLINCFYETTAEGVKAKRFLFYHEFLRFWPLNSHGRFVLLSINIELFKEASSICRSIIRNSQQARHTAYCPESPKIWFNYVSQYHGFFLFFSSYHIKMLHGIHQLLMNVYSIHWSIIHVLCVIAPVLLPKLLRCISFIVYDLLLV